MIRRTLAPVTLLCLAGCASEPPVLLDSDAALQGPGPGAGAWLDPDALRGHSRQAGEICDGLCQVRAQAVSERLLEAERERVARERRAELADEFDTFMEEAKAAN